MSSTVPPSRRARSRGHYSAVVLRRLANGELTHGVDPAVPRVAWELRGAQLLTMMCD